MGEMKRERVVTIRFRVATEETDEDLGAAFDEALEGEGQTAFAAWVRGACGADATDAWCADVDDAADEEDEEEEEDD